MIAALKYAVRSLARTPGFSGVVVLTLAFGVAVNAGIFGLFGALFLRPLPVPEPGRLGLVVERVAGWTMLRNLSFPDFRDLRARATSFTRLIAYTFEEANLSADGQAPERAWIQLVTPDAFAVMNVRAALGRMLVPADGEDGGGQPVAVLTHRYWQSRFGGDPGIVGRTIRLNGQPFTVIGVAAKGFDGFALMLQMSAFVPSAAMDRLYPRTPSRLEERGGAAWYVLGRLRPGATFASAGAEAQVIGRQLTAEHPQSHRHPPATFEVLPERSARPDPSIADHTRTFAALFLGLVTLVLFIACANVANLMLTRAVARQPELTLRAALGARRWHLVRQVLAEGIVLAVAAGAVGGVLSAWTGGLVMRLAFAFDSGYPLNLEYRPALRDFLFTAAIALFAGVASSLVPALRASRIDLMESLKRSAGGRGPAGQPRLQALLVIGQVVFSLVVLAGAGLFLRSLQRTRAVSLGFRTDRVLMVSYHLGLQGYSEQQGQEFSRLLLEKARALPGVEAATLTQHVPFDYILWGRALWPDNPPALMKDGNVSVAYNRVAPGYFEMMGLRLLRGRVVMDTDTAATRRVAVINQALADLCWPGVDPIGRRFRWSADGPWIEVVGVTATAKYMMLSEGPRPFVYVPLAQDYSAPLALMVRSRADPLALAADLRAAVRSLDPHLPVYQVRTMEHLLENSFFALMPMRLGATLAAFQGAIGLALAVMGLYAVVAYGVTRRTREIGIRMALGADGRNVVRLVMREGMRLTAMGLVLGLAVAAALGYALSRALYGLDAVEPGAVLGAAFVLLATAGLACYLPARRATRITPTVALRAE